MRSSRPRIMLALLVLGLPAPALRAAEEESLEAHAGRPQTVIQLDAQRVQPATATVEREGVIVFENYALSPITVRFIEPEDAQEKIRCHFARGKTRDKSGAPWLLFGLEGGKLAATIPPGRFASLCSLDPGTYTYVAEMQQLKTKGPAHTSLLSQKGQIVVR